ncbi:UNKNOWN [Stylonychia lemnae]|uniref:Uncharacterized protein n=1 Tax=Stylonychia lemnae TaxID=5949 RepID=A0A078BBB1_STYLE|nr:UNKNOWN [Stylonychia lemnae]|eukprot:CDW90853.1 UNKNOWN [Stylonychia lemnae]
MKKQQGILYEHDLLLELWELLRSTGEPFNSFTININVPTSAHYSWFLLCMMKEKGIKINQLDEILTVFDIKLANMFKQDGQEPIRFINNEGLVYESLACFRSSVYKMILKSSKREALFIPPIRVHKFHTNIEFQVYNQREITLENVQNVCLKNFAELFSQTIDNEPQLYQFMVDKAESLFHFLDFVSKNELRTLMIIWVNLLFKRQESSVKLRVYFSNLKKEQLAK